MSSLQDSPAVFPTEVLPPLIRDWEPWLLTLLRDHPPNHPDVRRDLVASVLAFLAMEECDHEPVLVRFYQSNKTLVYLHQCSKCWSRLSNFLPHRSLTDEEKASAQPRREFTWETMTALKMTMLARINECGTPAVAPTESDRWWADYNSYLQTPEWRTKRAKVLRRAGGMCEGCGEAPATIVHHLTYKRVGREMLFDLVAVCPACHDALHPEKVDRG